MNEAKGGATAPMLPAPSIIPFNFFHSIIDFALPTLGRLSSPMGPHYASAPMEKKNRPAKTAMKEYENSSEID